MDDKTPLLRMEHVSVEFATGRRFRRKQTLTALSDFSLDIMPGDMIAVVGESGCGKTTIGKVINEIYRPTSGHVYFGGMDMELLRKDAALHKKYRLAVQMVHQDSYAALNPSRTIFQSLCAPLLAHGIAGNRLEALDALIHLFSLVGLTPAEDFLFKFPHQLSGGQRQRVLLARALSVKPRLVVADEPVSMVDVSLRISLLNLMNQMNRELGVAFVYITHDLATARYVAQKGKLLVMYFGRTVELGDLEDVLSHPRHPYLQALLSAIPSASPERLGQRPRLLLKEADCLDDAAPTEGCLFCPRCLYSREICKATVPELTAVAGTLVACHRVKEVPVWNPTD